MERHGLIQRRKDTTDGRVSRVFLTERGRVLKMALEPAAAALIEEMFATLTPEEYHTLSNQIAHLRKTVPKTI
jgi:DNA-binding MarR family transcriptional regulator